jgi:hypothetical protein
MKLLLKNIKRRDFLKALFLSIIGCEIAPEVLAKSLSHSSSSFETLDDHIKDYLHKMKHFNEPYKNDIHIDSGLYKVFKSTVMRLRRLQQMTGHGNFHLLSLDKGISIARKFSRVGAFTGEEIGFMEMIFYTEASDYGFFGKKPLKKLTDRVKKDNVIKVPYTGNYIYKGIPFEIYTRITKQIGKKVILTSGVRGVLKQFLLFLNKAYKHNGNLSLASRSLAPPGYSFHGNGDFDVGQVEFGAANFTERFTTTEVYRRLSELGYLKLRYPENNLLGVRFEPWHVEINTYY